MPKIKSFKKLLASLGGLVLALLGIVYVGQMGVLKMIFGEAIANTLYSIMHSAIQFLSYIAVIIIIGLMIWCIYSYFQNRGKLGEPSDEVKAINKGMEAIRKDIKEEFEKFRADMKNDKSEQ